jgi:hypothetical protein
MGVLKGNEMININLGSKDVDLGIVIVPPSARANGA